MPRPKKTETKNETVGAVEKIQEKRPETIQAVKDNSDRIICNGCKKLKVNRNLKDGSFFGICEKNCKLLRVKNGSMYYFINAEEKCKRV